MSLGVQSVLKSIPVSGTFFYENMIMKILQWPFPIRNPMIQGELLSKECLPRSGKLPSCGQDNSHPRYDLSKITLFSRISCVHLFNFIDECCFKSWLTCIPVYLGASFNPNEVERNTDGDTRSTSHPLVTKKGTRNETTYLLRVEITKTNIGQNELK